ncbi:MAG: nucleotide exchange factor GrpE, partial [Microbacteriaceae bacterium]|nr:nucleotide exchange factor GrpE [Microbacteriaceae bacterium]
DDLRILEDAQAGLIAELKEDALRARAELVNFRTRVERDRQANRESTIAEVLRALLPALDDLDRAEAHGDLPEGSPMAIVAAKLHGAFGRFGLAAFGEKGDPFDPAQHEAIFQQPTPGAESETVLDVVEQGYRFGDRVIRPAKVAVAVPAKD